MEHKKKSRSSLTLVVSCMLHRKNDATYSADDHLDGVMPRITQPVSVRTTCSAHQVVIAENLPIRVILHVFVVYMYRGGNLYPTISGMPYYLQ